MNAISKTIQRPHEQPWGPIKPKRAGSARPCLSPASSKPTAPMRAGDKHGANISSRQSGRRRMRAGTGSATVETPGPQAWAATPARAKRRRAWRSKFPRCLGEALRDLEWLEEAAKARAAARRYVASLTLTTEETAAQIAAPKAGG